MDDFTEEVFMQHKEKTNTILIEKLKKNYSYEWEKLLFEYERPYIFHDTVLYLEDETIFDFWKNNFDIEKNLLLINLTKFIMVFQKKKNVFLFF